jgi:hypothetical protein
MARARVRRPSFISPLGLSSARCRVAVALALLGAGLAAGCGGAATNEATKNRTFYDWSLGDGSQAFERPYPRLNWPERTESPRFIGVSVLQGQVYFSRPGEPYIHYVSPNAYSFAIYQRRDPPADTWKDIIDRYTADVESVGAKIVGRLVPMATSNGQGRAFTVERSVEAAKRPLESHSREIVLRSGKMVTLVQIVHQENNLEAVDDELLRAVATIHLP